VDLSRSFAPFRHRPFALLWTGAFVSNIGTWMETVGVGILVTEVTHRAGWTGLVAAAAFVPGALLGPIGGALADRLPRRRVLLTTTAVQTALAGLLTFLAARGTPPPGLVTLIVFAGGCAMALGFPSFQAMLPDLVPEEDVVSAVALASAVWNLGRVIGPALAGIVIATGDYAWAFGINTVSFLAVIAVVLPLRLPPPATPTGATILGSIREGVRFARGEPGIRVVIGYMALNTFLAAPFIGLIPAMAIKVLHEGAGGTSALVTAQGVGAVTMAFSLGALAAYLGSRRVLQGVLWLLPPALVLYAVAPTIAFSVPAIFVVGFLYLGALSSFMSIAQLRAPSAVRGRVLSVLMVLLGTLYPLGLLVQGTLADAVGLRPVTAGAALLMLATLVITRVTRPSFAAALDRFEITGSDGAGPEPIPAPAAPGALEL